VSRRLNEEFGFGGGILSSGAEGVLKLSGPLMALATMIERRLGAPVLDETGIQGAFTINAQYQEGSTESLIQAVEKLGLKLTKARRPIEYLVVKKAQ
jgi:uncharacterized protein (TIGR03435 family)